MDGANVEMAEEIGIENMFIFGLNSQEVASSSAMATILIILPFRS